MITTKKKKKDFFSNNKTHSSGSESFCCIGHGLISAHLSAILVGNFLNLFFILFADYSIFEQKINKVTFFIKRNFYWIELCVVKKNWCRMADVNSDVLVLGACIMDFIWFVLFYSFNQYNHPRCHIITFFFDNVLFVSIVLQLY